jgi:hypothetical protein
MEEMEVEGKASINLKRVQKYAGKEVCKGR